MPRIQKYLYRNFNARYYEHQSSIRLNKNTSTMTDYAREYHLKLLEADNLDILHICDKELDYLEAIKITISVNNLKISVLNEQVVRYLPLFSMT